MEQAAHFFYYRFGLDNEVISLKNLLPFETTSWTKHQMSPSSQCKPLSVSVLGKQDRGSIRVAPFVLLITVMTISTAGFVNIEEAEGQSLKSRWASEVNPDAPLPKYPRPQMVRDHWVNLNGPWDYAVTRANADVPAAWTGTIIVPFAIESQLSGVTRGVSPEEALWYRRTFETPGLDDGGQLLLHFGGVDWETRVWVNGSEVGIHRGGFDAFYFDITDALKADGPNELLVKVTDPTDTGVQPFGKQTLDPRGIWYTAVTGIWQTVWLEPVPADHIESVKITPDLDGHRLTVLVAAAGADGLTARVVAEKDNAEGSGRPGQPIALELDPLVYDTPWSPDTPQLYDLTVELMRDGQVIDSIGSYFALRKIEVRTAEDGYSRLFLNNQLLFQYGLLDQGWWPDGLYTAPTDEALAYDIEMTKEMGFNMARKHVKVEPARWYYHADRLGLLVWQDMPNGDKRIKPGAPDLVRTPESESIFRTEWEQIVTELSHYPSVVVWVPFNEGWGQFKTNEILKWTKQLDPTRLVDGPSGWQDRGYGDMHDMHRYPGPSMFPTQQSRASVLGEFGGLGLPVQGHLWQTGKKNWGYRSFDTPEALAERYEQAVFDLRMLVGRGLAAAVYTQTTDVEREVNGLITYDRAVIKINPARLRKMHAPLYGPPQTMVAIAPTSEDTPQTWRYTMQDPGEGWKEPGFDDSSWAKGFGGFGTAGTPNVKPGTEWNGPQVWLRRTFTVDHNLDDADLLLRLYHDEDAMVFLNGELILERQGYTTNYVTLRLGPEARALLRQGENTLAVHCRQTDGGQFIDAGLLKLE